MPEYLLSTISRKYAIGPTDLFSFSHSGILTIGCNRSSTAVPLKIYNYQYVTIGSNSISSFSICSIWMFPRSQNYCLCSNSNWIYSILLPFHALLMLTSYLLNLKYYKLNSLNMEYNTVTAGIARQTDDLNTWSSTLCIPVNDSKALLDISSAAIGADSSVPPGAMNQPISFPKSKGLRSVFCLSVWLWSVFWRVFLGWPPFHVEVCGQWMQHISSQDSTTKFFEIKVLHPGVWPLMSLLTTGFCFVLRRQS